MTNASKRATAPVKRLAVLSTTTVLAASLLSGGIMVASGSLASRSDWRPEQGQQAPADQAATPGPDGASGSAALSSGSASSAAAPSSAASASSAAALSSDSGEAFSFLGESTVTSASTDDARAQNLSEAASAIDGLVIRPNEVFSIRDMLGNVAKSASYVRASESADGSSAAVNGGGICQVAAALLDASVQAGFQIVERHAHEAPCDYVAAGLDADIQTGDYDLKVRNVGESPVTIHAFTRGQSVTVELIGYPREGDETFSVVATIVDDAVPQGPETEAGKGADSETLAVETKRVTYENGVMQSSEVLFESTYRVYASSFVVGRGSAGISK